MSLAALNSDLSDGHRATIQVVATPPGNELFFSVTADLKRTNVTVSLDVGTHYIIMDTQVPEETINIRLRVSHGSQVIFRLASQTIPATTLLLQGWS